MSASTTITASPPTKAREAPAETPTPVTPPADDQVRVADLMPILNDWMTRYTACDDAERTLERTLGLRFMSRSYSYVSGAYDDDDRFTLNVARSPEFVTKSALARAVKTCARIHGRGSYGLNWLRTQLTEKLGVDLTEYRDSYRITWTTEITEEDLIRQGWGGSEDNVGDYARHMTNFRNATVEMVPDPRRTANAAD